MPSTTRHLVIAWSFRLVATSIGQLEEIAQQRFSVNYEFLTANAIAHLAKTTKVLIRNFRVVTSVPKEAHKKLLFRLLLTECLSGFVERLERPFCRLANKQVLYNSTTTGTEKTGSKFELPLKAKKNWPVRFCQAPPCLCGTQCVHKSDRCNRTRHWTVLDTLFFFFSLACSSAYSAFEAASVCIVGSTL